MHTRVAGLSIHTSGHRSSMNQPCDEAQHRLPLVSGRSNSCTVPSEMSRKARVQLSLRGAYGSISHGGVDFGRR